MSSRFAYLLERYPAFTQTFIVREVEEMRRQGAVEMIYSLRPADPDPGNHFPESARANIYYAPDPDALVAEIKRQRAAGELSKPINRRLEEWGKTPDKLRLYEAIWLGAELKKRGIRHFHVHFAGLAARTAFLVNELYGISYSVTGHAQDIFCKTDHPVKLGDILRRAKAVVTETRYSAEKLQNTYPAFAGKIHHVYNGISVPEKQPQRSEIDPPLILSIGRLIEKKGFENLISACAGLRDRGISFQCQIVGDGPLADSLQARIQDQKLTSHVKLLGARSQTEITGLLVQARVFALAAVLLPDGDSDNQPTVNSEAMSFGLPVVSTQVAGIPEQVENGVTGLLVKPGSVEELSQALEQLVTDATLSQKMGDAGFVKARRDFSLENTVKRLYQIVSPCPWWKFW